MFAEPPEDHAAAGILQSIVEAESFEFEPIDVTNWVTFRCVAEGRYSGATVAIGPDGLPFLVELDDRRLVYVRCEDAQCTKNQRRVLPASVAGGAHEVLATPGQPVVIVFQSESSELSIIRCPDDGCTSETTFMTIQPFPFSWWRAGRLDGDLAIAFHDERQRLALLRCHGDDCSAATPQILIEKSDALSAEFRDTGLWILRGRDVHPASIKRGVDWFVDVEHAEENVRLRLIRCDDECLDVELDGDMIPKMKYPLLATASGEPPLIITKDDEQGVFAVRCLDRYCSDVSVRPIDAASVFSATIGANGLPLIASNRGILRCLTPSCSRYVR